MEYDLSCVNTIVARYSCCDDGDDDEWMFPSRTSKWTILGPNMTHCVCVWIVEVDGTGRWSFGSHHLHLGKMVNYTQTSKATLSYEPFSFSLYKNNSQMPDTALSKNILDTSYHQMKASQNGDCSGLDMELENSLAITETQ